METDTIMFVGMAFVEIGRELFIKEAKRFLRISILWFIASVVAAANFFRGLLADPGPDETSLFLRGVVVLLFLTDAIVYLVRYRRAKRASEE